MLTGCFIHDNVLHLRRLGGECGMGYDFTVVFLLTTLRRCNRRDNFEIYIYPWWQLRRLGGENMRGFMISHGIHFARHTFTTVHPETLQSLCEFRNLYIPVVAIATSLRKIGFALHDVLHLRRLGGECVEILIR